MKIYCRAGQATDDDMAHAHCMLDIWGYRYALRICNTYWFSTTKMAHERVSVLRDTYIGLSCYGVHLCLTKTKIIYIVVLVQEQHKYFRLLLVLLPRLSVLSSVTRVDMILTKFYVRKFHWHLLTLHIFS
jgi:hypothetical protein